MLSDCVWLVEELEFGELRIWSQLLMKELIFGDLTETQQVWWPQSSPQCLGSTSFLNVMETGLL